MKPQICKSTKDSAFWLVFQVTRVDADISESQHGGSEGDWRTLCSSPALLVFYFHHATANTGWENCAPVGFMWGCLFTQVLSYCCRSGKLPATFYGHWMRRRQQPEAVLFYGFHDFETTALSVGGQCQDLLGVLTREEELGTHRAALCRQMIRVQFGRSSEKGRLERNPEPLSSQQSGKHL